MVLCKKESLHIRLIETKVKNRWIPVEVHLA